MRRRPSAFGLILASSAANLAAVVKRVLIVVPSQTHGALMPLERGTYLAAGIEIGVMLGLVGMITAVFLIFGRVFPLVPSEHPPVTRALIEAEPALGRRERLRASAAGFTILVAVALIVIGLLDSFRVIDPSFQDPRIPFSPVLFALGVMTLFSAAIVYEVWPTRRTGEPPAPAEEARTGVA